MNSFPLEIHNILPLWVPQLQILQSLLLLVPHNQCLPQPWSTVPNVSEANSPKRLPITSRPGCTVTPTIPTQVRRRRSSSAMRRVSAWARSPTGWSMSVKTVYLYLVVRWQFLSVGKTSHPRTRSQSGVRSNDNRSFPSRCGKKRIIVGPSGSHQPAGFHALRWCVAALPSYDFTIDAQ